ncbi:indolepyruvate ferredoxin oxidoreductase subunit alpha [Vallitalea sp.]|uniref:indolepyruvate ferredoxin oxidoreductase subunit alpha n=1 Tax=Vallitalea sp. TaxID=1882829 RepID=UPI0025EB085B|nr:indolepyruvate ferredoxin oxidoreductase subunit alpha [Vallitalea sp.]MCT4686721.1 indolepyruvate ferredoxin oxidoreductase subunit alpha [Vallitalea sp.]
MATELLMGNEAIAMGAITAGVNIVTGYPGTPSTEILEYVFKKNDGNIYVEWSVNEKVALEVAAGASYAGLRSMVTMKQVGLNVSSDPLMSLAYIGVNGGMVIVVADDPGPISSQTEQDTRFFGMFSKIPVFDPSSPEEAYDMIKDAFEYSEKYKTPVLFRPTTRICHSSSIINVTLNKHTSNIGHFHKSPDWCILPKLTYENHLKIIDKVKNISNDFSHYRFNNIIGTGKMGIVSEGISYEYTREALKIIGIKENSYKLLKISTPYPFPEDLVAKFLSEIDVVIVIEELEPVIERELLYICGKLKLNKNVKGKLSNYVPQAGENSIKSIIQALSQYFNISLDKYRALALPKLPKRPPTLCAGCPHRASFYAVKQATLGHKAVFSGDIGCYTLGNTMPLDMVDTCLCMGAGVTISQGLHRAEPDTVNFAFIGDSTFFHSGITGIVNAIYNKTDIIVIILDNSTTAMTGHQPTPETGFTMMKEKSTHIDISKVLTGLGLTYIKIINPFQLDKAIKTVSDAITQTGVRAIILKAPCVALAASQKCCYINNKCINCQKCLDEIGCPAISKLNGKVEIDNTLCIGCGVCSYVCPVGAIYTSKKHKN